MPPALRSWIPGADASDFPLAHLPLGVRRRPDASHAVCTRIGDRVADLRVLAEIGVFDDAGASRDDFSRPSLNALLTHAPAVLAAVRARVIACLDDDPNYWDLRQRAKIFLLPADAARLTSPILPGDYARFASRHDHYREARAANVLVRGAATGFGESPHLRARAGLGLALSVADGEALPYGVLGLVDWFADGDDFADELRAGHRTVLEPWLTPLDAFATGTTTVTASVLGGGHVSASELLRTRAELPGETWLTQLRTAGALSRAGDLLATSVGPLESPDGTWVRGDLPRVSVRAWERERPRLS